MESSLPAFDDSWLLDLDVPRFPEIRPQDEMLSGPQPDNGSHDRTFNPSPHENQGSWQHALDRDQHPVSDASYSLGEWLTNNSWEKDLTVGLESDFSKPSNRDAFDCFTTNSILSKQPAFGSRSREPAEALMPPSSPKAKTRKRRALSDSTRAKAKSVRRAGACLRCRVYKEPVAFFLLYDCCRS